MEPATPTVNMLQDTDGSITLQYLNCSSDCDSPLVSNTSPVARLRINNEHNEENTHLAASPPSTTPPKKLTP